MSIAQIDEGYERETDTLNNASRIGFKSKFKISENLNFLVQVENEIDPADGRADGDKVFKQRNTFIGISGDFGKLFVGANVTNFHLFSSQFFLTRGLNNCRTSLTSK